MENKALVDWDSDLLDCFEDASTCCYGFWCCPCLSCTVSGRLGENRWLPLWDVCSCLSMLIVKIPLCTPPANLALRNTVRHRYNLKGSLCCDLAAATFCCWCSWCQMHRELKHHKKTPTIINVNNTAVYTTQPAPLMSLADHNDNDDDNDDVLKCEKQ